MQNEGGSVVTPMKRLAPPESNVSADRGISPLSMADSWMVLHSGSEREDNTPNKLDEDERMAPVLNYTPSVHSANRL
jgi:hypothetical protein